MTRSARIPSGWLRCVAGIGPAGTCTVTAGFPVAARATGGQPATAPHLSADPGRYPRQARTATTLLIAFDVNGHHRTGEHAGAGRPAPGDPGMRPTGYVRLVTNLEIPGQALTGLIPVLAPVPRFPAGISPGVRGAARSLECR